MGSAGIRSAQVALLQELRRPCEPGEHGMWRDAKSNGGPGVDESPQLRDTDCTNLSRVGLNRLTELNGLNELLDALEHVLAGVFRIGDRILKAASN